MTNYLFECKHCDYKGSEGWMHMINEHKDALKQEHPSPSEERPQDVIDPEKAKELAHGVELLELMSRFSLHRVDDDGRKRMAQVRQACFYAAAKIKQMCPDDRYTTIAINKMVEAMWAANSAIAFSYPPVLGEYHRSESPDG